MNIRIGSRKSVLAMKQTEEVIKILESHFPDDTFEIVGISTKGDRQLNRTLQSFGGKGVFIKEIETSLLNGEIDMAVHSAKDMPTEMPDNLEISAALLREDRSDVLVCFGDIKTNELKIIGTGSARRKAQAQKLYPNAVFKSIRGNIHTRLEKLQSGEYDAIIMAKAAINRLEIADVNIISFGDDFICAAGQGILAVETICGKMKKYTEAINDVSAMTELTAERAFLKHIGGGCHTPCGASAVYDGVKVTMNTFCGDTKSEVVLSMSGSNPTELGKEMASKTLEMMEGH